MKPDGREIFRFYDDWGDLSKVEMINHNLKGNRVVKHYREGRLERKDVFYPNGNVFEEYYNRRGDVIKRIFLYRNKKIVEEYRRDRLKKKTTYWSDGKTEIFHYNRVGKITKEETHYKKRKRRRAW
ncbi:hypothetical protein ACFL2R_04330 [Patescibacteria group bacterium]